MSSTLANSLKVSAGVGCFAFLLHGSVSFLELPSVTLNLAALTELFNWGKVRILLLSLTIASLGAYIMLRVFPLIISRSKTAAALTPQFSPFDVGSRAAVMSIKGHRQHMEDTYQAIPSLGQRPHWSFYGVFDGHGGGKCSAFTAQFLHRYIWKCLDSHIGVYSVHNFIKSSNSDLRKIETDSTAMSTATPTAAAPLTATSSSGVLVAKTVAKKKRTYKDIPPYIQKMMKEALVEAHRDADREFLKIANRRQWQDGTTSISCLLLPAVDLMQLLTDPNTGISADISQLPQTQSAASKKEIEKSETKAKSNEAIVADSQEISLSESQSAVQSESSSEQQQSDSKASDGVCIEKQVGGGSGVGAECSSDEHSSLLSALQSAKESDTWLFVCNTGDSRCILVTADGRAIAMSYDHKPNRRDERRRIEAEGGRVVFFGTWRVEGILAVARALGDRHLKQWVIPDPDIVCRKVQPTDLLLILASDGIWDVLSNADAARMAYETWNKPAHRMLPTKERLAKVSTTLTTVAFRTGSMDNITTLVVHLNSHCTYKATVSKEKHAS